MLFRELSGASALLHLPAFCFAEKHLELPETAPRLAEGALVDCFWWLGAARARTPKGTPILKNMRVDPGARHSEAPQPATPKAGWVPEPHVGVPPESI
eukprot:10605581-Alexandrium_andersonii.AAC.3